MPKPRSAKYTVPASEGRGVPVDDPSKQMIHVKGARVHNLKNIEVQIPHNELVVITGLSGSGKSTLAFDTIFAEGSGVMSKACRPMPGSSSARSTSPRSISSPA